MIRPRRLAVAAIALAQLSPVARAADAPVADPVRSAVARAVARVRPALVRIHVVEPRFWGGREVKGESFGSGTIITPEGHVVTNHHVAGHAIRLVCTLSDNEEIPAVLVGTDPLSDIAIIRLTPAAPRTFPTVAFGDSDTLAQGDTILAMGSPMALAQSVTQGIVSNTRLTLPAAWERHGALTLDGEDVGSIVRWIGHDAAIYGGNSGGPLVNLQGEMIGVNEIEIGLSGAIPANLARDIAGELMKTGRVRRSWLGIDIQPALKVGAPAPGILLGGVLDGTPAAKAGLRAGDILTRLDGREISARFREELPLFNQQVATIPVGRAVKATVLRGGRLLEVTLTTAERDTRQPEPEELRAWGLTARDLSGHMTRELKLGSSEGALVTSIRQGGPAGDAKPALEPGDVIVEFAGTKIAGVAALRDATARKLAGAAGPVPALTRFVRRTEQLLTVVKVGVRDLQDPGLEVRKAWLPATVQVITRDVALQLGRKDLQGVRITRVYAGSAAAQAGLRVGDLITAVNKEPVVASQPGDEDVFTTMIRQLRVGDRATFTGLRDGKDWALTMELGRMPPQEREQPRYRDDDFEFTARDVSFFDRVREEWPDDQPGAIVTEVKEGSWSAVGGLSTGDLLLAVGAAAVRDTASLEAALTAARKGKPKSVVLHVRRGIHHRYLELEPAWRAEGKPR